MTDPTRRNSLRTRLSYRQTLLTLALTVMIGLIFTTGTIFLDFRAEKDEIRDHFYQIIETVQKPAAQAIFNIDPGLAVTVADGLIQNELIYSASVIDDLGEPLATLSKAPSEGRLSWLSAALFSEEAIFVVDVEYPQSQRTIGQIEVLVDTNLIGRQFFQRAVNLLIGGLARNIVLGGCLLVLFYFTLTRPLIRLATDIRDAGNKNSPPEITVPEPHRDNELGLIARTLKDVLTSLEDARREEVQMNEQLRQQQARLEDQVNSRTEELRAQNELLQAEIEARLSVESALRQSRQEAESASTAKSNFLANMSHELRSPLNGILGLTQVMERETFGPLGDRKYNEYMADILSAGNHLLALINDLLDLSKIEAGEFDLDMHEVDLKGVVDFSKSVMMPDAIDKSIDLKASAPDSLIIMGDERILKQVVVNFLSNAVKFTGEGGQIDLTLTGSENGGARIAIRDNGVGMTEDEISEAFIPFRQVGDPTIKDHGGTGLGLPLAKRFLELHHARLQIKSAPNKGTTITMDLPRDPRDSDFKTSIMIIN